MDQNSQNETFRGLGEGAREKTVAEQPVSDRDIEEIRNHLQELREEIAELKEEGEETLP